MKPENRARTTHRPRGRCRLSAGALTRRATSYAAAHAVPLAATRGDDPASWLGRRQCWLSAVSHSKVAPMPKPLREEINDVVERYLEHKLRTGEPVDVLGMAHEMA